MAGKDRTGVIVALLLKLCGVENKTILADYAETDPEMHRFLNYLIETNSIAPENVPPPRLFINKQAMINFLKYIDTEIPSLETYLINIGVKENNLNSIKRYLIE